MSKLYLVDTNVFIENLESLEGKKIVVFSGVLRELEKHKANKDPNKLGLAWSARQAVRWINENIDNDNVQFDLKDYTWESDDPYENNYVDNLIIKACLVNNYGLISNDVLLKFKALGYGIDFIEANESKIHGSSTYTGVIEIDIDNEQDMIDIYEDKENKLGLHLNQYLILNYNGETECTRWNGHELVDLVLPDINVVDPQNAHQACALDLLNDDSIPIKFIIGTYGSGKTYLSVKVALEKVTGKSETLFKSTYERLMIVRNPIGSGEQIGFLKGGKEEKTADFYKPIIQHLEGGEMEAAEMEENEKLVKEIPYYMKGLSIEDTFILVDEAEDLNEKLVKLVGTRLGNNSCVVFSGDFNQAEDKYIRNNGLFIAIDKLKGNPLVGIVSLKEDVRSDASKVFAEM